MRPLKFSVSALAFAASLACAPADAAEQNAPAPATRPVGAAKQVDVEAFDKARRAKDTVVIDVRSPEEFAAGHIPGAVNVPVTGKGSEEFEKKVSAAAKDKTVLVHCRSGVRSAKAVERMRQMGVSGIIEMPKGWVGWSDAGKPVEKRDGVGQSEQ